MLVTPGVIKKIVIFLNICCSSSSIRSWVVSKGDAPLEFVGEELVRRLFLEALSAAPVDQRLNLFPPGLRAGRASLVWEQPRPWPHPVSSSISSAKTQRGDGRRSAAGLHGG